MFSMFSTYVFYTFFSAAIQCTHKTTGEAGNGYLGGATDVLYET